MTSSQHVHEVRPRKDHPGVEVISDALPFGRLRYCALDAITNAIGYAKFYRRSHDVVIRVCDKLQFAVTNRRSGRYGNTSSI
jgi:peroxiredoxin